MKLKQIIIFLGFFLIFLAYLAEARNGVNQNNFDPSVRMAQRYVRRLDETLNSVKTIVNRAVNLKNTNMKANNYNMALDRIARASENIDEVINILGENHPLVGELYKKIDAARKYVYEKLADIRQQEISSTKAPEEKYTGKDKEKFREMIKKAWLEKYPEDEIISIRFPNASWKRNRTKRWNDSAKEWQYNDISTLLASVIVKNKNGKTATIYPAYINKDNISGEIRLGVETKTGGYVVEEMLLSNLK